MSTENEKNVGWREEVEGELKEVLQKFLPLSEQGGWGIKYLHPVVETYENGTVKYDESKCVGAMMYIQFEFEDTYNIEEVKK